jgi:hypothetical protein
VGVGFHTWGYHPAPYTRRESGWNRAGVLYRGRWRHLELRWPDGHLQTLQLPSPMVLWSWYPRDYPLIADHDAGTVAQTWGGWTFFDVAGRYLGTCGNWLGMQLLPHAEGSEFHFIQNIISAERPSYRCDFATGQLRPVPPKPPRTVGDR